MVFSDNAYRTLLVSRSPQLNDAILPLLPAASCEAVGIVSTFREATAYLKSGHLDLMLVNAPLPDGDALAFCQKWAASSDIGILLLTRREEADSVALHARESGVLCLAKPLSSQQLSLALQALCVQRERFRLREADSRRVEETIEELKLVDRAKWLLIECLRMTEDEAHRTIGKLAMQQQRSRREVAEGIIRTYAQ